MSKQINNLNNSLKKQLYLNEKQDKIDNNLETKDKTIIGAINEIQNSYATAEYVDVNLKKTSGDLTNLQTNNKTNLVGAINELFQNANNGKELIASAIGEPLNAEDTFSAMSNDINGLLSQFKTNMMNNGITVESGDKFKSLIDKIATMVEEGSSKGIKFATGSLDTFKFSKNYQTLNFNTPIGFVPTYLFVHFGYIRDQYSGSTYYNVAISNIKTTNIPDNSQLVNTKLTISNLSENGFSILGSQGATNETMYSPDFMYVTWYAIGVGEEDTTLRDSLASILQEEGVSVTEEDDMASLIGKVDEEFAKDNNTISELEDDIENTRNKLAGLMQEGGYDITGEEDINSLLELLVISGIKSDEIKQISSGNAYSMLLTTDGSLYATGSGSDGRTGLGDTVKRMAFVNVLDDVVQVACGNNYTLVVKNDGSLWGCGFNGNGQLGLSDTADRLTFTEITTGVKQVACGYSHSVILKTDGTVWACGFNTYGQLGLGNTTNKKTFTKVTTNVSNVKQIACGENHTVMLKTDGSLYSCGRNGSGQLGLSSTTDKTTFTKITTNVNNDVKQVACGKTNVFILKNDGSVWACGYNTNSFLGVGYNDNRTSFTQVTTNVNNDVKQIACGEYHTLLLKNDGSVWGCGANTYGQLGLDNNTNQKTFTKATTNVSNVKQIYCGGSHTFILKNDGSVWACGSNGSGGLGLCTEAETINSTFIKIPKSF